MAGALAGMRVVVIIVALWLMSVAVDPDALLRLFRRISYRSALTASLATRLVPVLARDASRMSEAARCRPYPAGRLRGGALGAGRARSTGPWTWPPRSSCAATRWAGARRGGACRGRATTSGSRRPAWASCCVAVAGRIAGVAGVDTYPRLQPRAGRRRAGARGRDRAARRGAVRGTRGAAGGGPCLSRSWSRESFSYTYPEAREPALRDVTLRSSRAPSPCWRACRAPASPRCCARSAASCRTSTAAARRASSRWPG